MCVRFPTNYEGNIYNNQNKRTPPPNHPYQGLGSVVFHPLI